MYRAPILGSSVDQGLEYASGGPSGTNNDETEDLYSLLATVKEAHPDIEGVSVGAILSTYQRTRVESVCARLGLVSLAYLWQRDQGELLDEIIASGLDARIIKVAGVGLSKDHLGKSLGQVRGDLIKLNRMYGIHFCGEGGEYETLVLDAPMFKKRLKLHLDDCVLKDFPSDYVAYLESIRVTIEDKEAVGEVDQELKLEPPVLEEQFEEILNDIPESLEAFDAGDPATPSQECPKVFDQQSFVTIANITAPSSSLQSEVEQIFKILTQELAKQDMTLFDVSMVSLLVQDMASFAEVNGYYSQYFKYALPPARLCVEKGTIGARVQLSAIAFKRREGEIRKGLHVQGRSYWAPANIGPYAQTIESDQIYFLSGQIGLLPKDLSLVPDARIQSVISLQHLTRVSRSVDATLKACVAFTDTQDLVPLIRQTWRLYLDSLAEEPELLIAVVDALPREARVEWSGYSVKEAVDMYEDNDDSAVNAKVVEGYPTGPFKVANTYATGDVNRGLSNCEVIPVNGLYDMTKSLSIASIVLN